MRGALSGVLAALALAALLTGFTMACLWLGPYLATLPMWLRSVMFLVAGMGLGGASYAIFPGFRK